MNTSNELKNSTTTMSSDPGYGDLFPQYSQKRNSKSNSWFDIDPHTQRMADLSPGARDYVLYQRMNQSGTKATMSKLPYRSTRVQHRRPKLVYNNNNTSGTNTSTININSRSQRMSSINASSFSTWPSSDDVLAGQNLSTNGSRPRASRRKDLGSYPYGVHILTALEEEEYTLSDACSAITMTTTATVSTTQLNFTTALLALDWRTTVKVTCDSGFTETLELADNNHSNYNKLDVHSVTLTPNYPTTYCATTRSTTM
jgi:hypothetical protein